MDKTGTTQGPTARLSKVIRQKVKDNALRQTELFDISRSSKLLRKLDTYSTVHPQLEHVKFYKQGGDKISDYFPQTFELHRLQCKEQGDDEISDYIPQTFKLHRKRMEEREMGYRRATTLRKILENFKEGHICFAGHPGSGKTTLLSSLTRDIIEGKKYENFSDDKVVHFVRLRSFKREDVVTPAELLFRNVEPAMSESEMKEAMQYAKENPDNVIFVIDGLDTIPYTIDGVYTGVTLEERASPEAILYHLLAGELIPGGRFITSSREFAIRNYRGNVQAKQVIALAGLTNESMRKIVVGYLKEQEADKIIAFLKSKPIIESLCSTPLWLIFTLMALKTKSSFKPSTMAGILVTVIQSMIRSEHVHQDDIESIFDKLAEMAFTGTTQRRVEFAEGELGNYDLDLSDIIDLMIVTPSGAFQRLIFGDSTLIYGHQCLQEILTAFRIAKMEYEKFKAFIMENINKPYFAIVRRLLTGILMNEEVFVEAENFLENGGDFARKKVFLKKTLKERLQLPGLNDEDRLELYICLSEGGDGLTDILRDNVRDFNFGFTSLSPSEIYTIGWVMSQQTSINRLILRGCNLSSVSIFALYHALERSNVKLKEFYVRCNDLGPGEMMLIAKISKQCKVDILRVNTCKLKSGALRSFLDSSVGLKLKEFDVGGNDLGPEEMTLIAKISRQCTVDILGVQYCELKSEALRSFLDCSVGLKLKEFDVSGNDLGPEEMTLIAKISRQCKVDILGVQYCKLKSEALRSFLDCSVGLKISKLDIGEIQLMDDNAGAILGLFIKQRGVETLLIYDPYDLEKINVKAFKFSSLDHYRLDKVKSTAMYNEFSSEHVQKICRFLPYVGKELDLTRFETPEGTEGILQSQLDEGKNKDLKIICTVVFESGDREKKILISRKSAGNYSPTIVENRRAELNNGVIVVSWQYPEKDAGMVCHVETFRDDQPTGEIKICKELCCEIRDLLPSTAYCFKIWTVASNGNAGQAMFTNEVVSCPLSVRNLHLVFVSNEISQPSSKSIVTGREIIGEPISKSFSKEIPPEGGTITVGGCSIQFRPRTFTVQTKVCGKVEINQRKWPANYTSITALFFIYTVNNLSMPAIVRMKSWCAPGLSKEGKSIMAHVLHFREDIKSWEVLEELPLNDEYVFQFECKKFSPVQVALKDENCGQERYLIDSTIFTFRNTFSVVSHLRDGLLESQLEDKMEKRGFHPRMDFSPIHVMPGDNIRVVLLCAAPEGFSFPANEALNLTISEEFLREKYFVLNAALKKNTDEPIRERLEMRTHIEKRDHGLLDGPHSFYYEWEGFAQDEEFRTTHRRTRRDDGAKTEPKEVRLTEIQPHRDSEQPTTSRLAQSSVRAQILEEAQHPNEISQWPGTPSTQGFGPQQPAYEFAHPGTLPQQYVGLQAVGNSPGTARQFSQHQPISYGRMEYAPNIAPSTYSHHPSHQVMYPRPPTNRPSLLGMQSEQMQISQRNTQMQQQEMLHQRHSATPEHQLLISGQARNQPGPGSGYLQQQQQQERYGPHHDINTRRMPNTAPLIYPEGPPQHGSYQMPSAIQPSPLDMQMQQMLISQGNMQQHEMLHQRQREATPEQQTSISGRMRNEPGAQYPISVGFPPRQVRHSSMINPQLSSQHLHMGEIYIQQGTPSPGYLGYAPGQAGHSSMSHQQLLPQYLPMQIQQGAQFPGYLGYAPAQAEHPSAIHPQLSAELSQTQMRGMYPQQTSVSHLNPLQTGLPGRHETPRATGHQVYFVGLQGMQGPSTGPGDPRMSQLPREEEGNFYPAGSPTMQGPRHEASLDPSSAQIPSEYYTPRGLEVQSPYIERATQPSQIGHSGYHPQQIGHPGYQQTYEGLQQSHPAQAAFPPGFGGEETVPKAPLDVLRVSRSPQTPPELPEPALVVEGPRIRASWDAPEDSHRLTYCVNRLKLPPGHYCVNIYCNDQLCENMPLTTRNTSVEYPIRPSCRYSCQVWAVNSRGVEGRKSWSSCVVTCASQQQQSCPSVETATRSNTPARTPSQEPRNTGSSATAETSSTSSTQGAAGGQHPVCDVTSAVTNVHITRSTYELYTAHLYDNKIYTIEQHRRKGRVLIINNEFLNTKSWREGSEVDVRNMEKLWREMGFDIEKRLNLTAQQMLDFCRQFAQQTRDVSVVVVIVMSHGGKAPDGKEYFVGEDHRRANVDDIVFFFTSNQSRHLRGIPKLFLFQACRGIELDVVADAETEAPEVQQLAPPPEGPYFQERSDMLITFPTQYGNKALRNTAYGSWHMNAITHVFMQHAHDTHVLDMLTMVNDEVAKKITLDRRIQISNQLHFFRKKLFLFPGWPN